MSDRRPPDSWKDASESGSDNEPTQFLGPVPPSRADTAGASQPTLLEPSSEPGDLPAEDPHASGSIIGSMVGSIRVLSPLALGGVGELYVGHDETLRRKVVLKALRGDRRSPRWRSRLLREARILSRLQDPKICQIHDYVEGEGTDFLVLELIEGRTLRQARKDDLDASLRMGIAQQLAEVLAKAHANGVIHRDLKPSNVMLTPDGLVKVLDFGIASSVEDEPLEPRQSSETEGQLPAEGLVPAPTLPGRILGTLAYMSPEQARGEPVAAASDIYSFGLMLQELFTGRRAYDDDRSFETLAPRVIAAQSQPVGGIDKDLAELITGMKALAPEDRPTAAAVAARLHWIAEKGKRRLRTLVAALGAGLLILALLFHVRGLERERNRARASERQAVAARLEAERVADFLEEMFKVSNPSRAKGETITAREILDQAAGRIDDELADQPLMQARLMATMGSVYFHLGLYERAEELLRKALEVRREHIPPDGPEIADSARRLGHLLSELTELDDAMDLFEEARRIDTAAFGEQSPQVAASLQGLVTAQIGLSNLPEAEALALPLLEFLEKRPEGERDGLEVVLRSLGSIYRNQGQVEKALPYYERVRAIDEAAGDDTPGAGMTLYHLAITYVKLGRYEEAEAMGLRGREIWLQTLGPEHSEIAKIDLALASIYRHLERFDEAEGLLQQAIEIWEKAVGADNAFVAIALNNLGSVYLEQERWAEAEATYRRALTLLEATYGTMHPNVSMTYANLGQLLWARGRWDEAQSSLERALTIDEEISGPNHTDVGWDLYLLANLDRDRGRTAQAEGLYERSFAILDEALGADHPAVVEAREEYQRLLDEAGD